MKVYTRGGDAGETSLFGGRRVPKDAPRVLAYGEVDELNAQIGLALAELSHGDLRRHLLTVQSSLFDLGAELAAPGSGADSARRAPRPSVTQAEVEQLEGWIDELDAELTPLASFILPGGERSAALLHVARVVCRRAERQVVSLAASEPVDAAGVAYLNRLSDYLFTAARTANARAGVEEPKWVGRER